jgi:hypothetical protein
VKYPLLVCATCGAVVDTDRAEWQRGLEGDGSTTDFHLRSSDGRICGVAVLRRSRARQDEIDLRDERDAAAAKQIAHDIALRRFGRKEEL